MGSILAPASSALGALGGVAQGLSQIVQRTLQLVASPFALVGNTAEAAGSVLAGGEVALSNTTDVQSLEGVSETLIGGSAIETPVNENTAALQGGSALVGATSETLVGGSASAASETLVGGSASASANASETLVGGGANASANASASETLVGGSLEAPVFIPLPMSGGARSRKRRASPKMRHGRKGGRSRSRSRSKSRSRSRSGGKKKRSLINIKRKASPRRHRSTK